MGELSSGGDGKMGTSEESSSFRQFRAAFRFVILSTLDEDMASEVSFSESERSSESIRPHRHE